MNKSIVLLLSVAAAFLLIVMVAKKKTTTTAQAGGAIVIRQPQTTSQGITSVIGSGLGAITGLFDEFDGGGSVPSVAGTPSNLGAANSNNPGSYPGTVSNPNGPLGALPLSQNTSVGPLLVSPLSTGVGVAQDPGTDYYTNYSTLAYDPSTSINSISSGVGIVDEGTLDYFGDN